MIGDVNHTLRTTDNHQARIIIIVERAVHTSNHFRWVRNFFWPLKVCRKSRKCIFPSKQLLLAGPARERTSRSWRATGMPTKHSSNLSDENGQVGTTANNKVNSIDVVHQTTFFYGNARSLSTVEWSSWLTLLRSALPSTKKAQSSFDKSRVTCQYHVHCRPPAKSSSYKLIGTESTWAGNYALKPLAMAQYILL